MNNKFPLTVAHISYRVFRGAGEIGALGPVHLAEEEEAGVEGEGEGALVLLPVPLGVAEGEADLDSLVGAGGGREGAGAEAAVVILDSAVGGAAVLVNDVPVVAEGGVGGKENPVPADLSTA